MGYSYEKTEYPQIRKQFKDGVETGKYVVTLDYGRQRRTDRKTGKIVVKQVKTSKTAASLREAKAILSQNNKRKEKDPVTGTTKKIFFRDAIMDYINYRKPYWSSSTYEREMAYVHRACDFMGDTELKRIDPGLIERFFSWCYKPEGPRRAIRPTTAEKIKCTLGAAWDFFIKNSQYGIRRNVAREASVIGLDQDMEFVGHPLNETQLNILIRTMLDNETDYSIFALIGLVSLAGLRRGEILGLTWEDVHMDNTSETERYGKRIYVRRQRADKKASSGDNDLRWKWRVPKHGKTNGGTPESRKERWTACPDPLAVILELVREQQEEYLGRPVRDDDFVYREKVNLVDHYLPIPAKVSWHFTKYMMRLKKILKKAGIYDFPDFRLHDLRHTFATICAEHQVYPLQIAASMGHAFDNNKIMTFKVYWHDQGNRRDINKCFKEAITTPIRAPEFSGWHGPVKNKRTNRRNDEL